MNNVLVPMDLSHYRVPTNRRGRGHRAFNNSRPRQYASNTAQLNMYADGGNQVQVDTTQIQETQKQQKGPCFKCGRMGHLAAECYS
jgi:hypothetical protein